jgi:branched-chain amino acid transport system permease protein
MQLAIVTVAVVFGAQELMKQWDAINAPSGVSVTGPPWLMDERALYVATAVIAIIGYIAVWNLLHSRSGRAIRALSANPHAALAVGIDTVRYRLIVFVLSGMLTGLAGVVYLYWAQTITPETFTLDLSLAFLTMMILGGSGSLGGSLLGAVIIGLLPQALKVLPSQIGQLNTQQSAAGLYAILLLLAVRCFPEGLWNAVAARVQRQNAGGDVLTRD